ncbi:TPA: hypothetical protein ACTYSP_004180 [Citrobacter freundii]
MAERHSIDHPPGSQDLSSAFFNYHRKSGGLWYIKNEQGQFIDGSDDFSSTFFIDTCPPTPLNVIDDHSIFGFFSDRIKDVENCVRNDKCRRAILVSLSTCKRQEPYILTINTFMNGVYVRIDSLYFMGFEREITIALCGNINKSIDNNAQHHRFDNVNPFLELDPDDWLVAWLMIVGVSQREIAEMLSLHLKAIEKKASNIYTTLILRDHDAFMRMSLLHKWSKFIPPKISTTPILFELRLM